MRTGASSAMDAAEKSGKRIFVGGHRSQNVDALDIAAALPYAVQRRLPVEPGRDVILDIPVPPSQLNARNQ